MESMVSGMAEAVMLYAAHVERAGVLHVPCAYREAASRAAHPQPRFRAEHGGRGRERLRQ
jgi:hypothetical protein